MAGSAHSWSTRGIVQANSTQLTTIVSIDPICANFYVDEASFMRYQEAIKAGKAPKSLVGSVPVWLQLDTEQGYPHKGVIDFVNNAFDSSTKHATGSWSIPQSRWFSASKRLRCGTSSDSPKYEGILVADRAINFDQDQKYVVIIQPRFKNGIKKLC